MNRMPASSVLSKRLAKFRWKLQRRNEAATLVARQTGPTRAGQGALGTSTPRLTIPRGECAGKQIERRTAKKNPSKLRDLKSGHSQLSTRLGEVWSKLNASSWYNQDDGVTDNWDA